MAQLHHPLRSRQAPQDMKTKIGQPRLARQMIDNDRLGHTRQHGLATMREIS